VDLSLVSVELPPNDAAGMHLDQGTMTDKTDRELEKARTGRMTTYPAMSHTALEGRPARTV